MMKYEIKLYAHGVPKGQNIWGVENFDRNYIEMFYGRRSNFSAQMFVEVRQFAHSTYCYYTYLRTGICGKEGRAGSYFALTVRINYYYADIKNIYNLLVAAYNKFVVGSIVKVNEGVTKYLIANIAQADTTLKSLEQELKKYLMQFSSDSDFIPLSGFRTNGHNKPVTVNILECDARDITNHVKESGSISVSPFQLSNREQQIIQDMKAKVNAANDQAQKQISEAQQNAQRNVDIAKRQAQEDVAAAIRDKEAGIQAIRKERKEAAETINSLRKENDKIRKENDKKEEKIMSLNDGINNLKLKLQECLSELNEKSEVIDINSQPHNTDENRSKSTPKEEKNLSLMNVIRKFHPITDFLVMIVLLGIIGITLPKSCDDIVQKPQFPLKEIFSKAICVDGISVQNPMKCGNKYTVTLNLKNVEEYLNGEWVSNDFDISDGNQITPKGQGQCTISYIVGNDTLVTRTIKVQ